MTLPPPPPMPAPEMDEVIKLLLAMDAYTDARVKLATAPPDMFTAREREADAAKAALEVALRHALHAAAFNKVSRTPVLRPDSSQRMRAVSMPALVSTLPAPPGSVAPEPIDLLSFDDEEPSVRPVDREAVTKPE